MANLMPVIDGAGQQAAVLAALEEGASRAAAQMLPPTCRMVLPSLEPIKYR